MLIMLQSIFPYFGQQLEKFNAGLNLNFRKYFPGMKVLILFKTVLFCAVIAVL